MAVKIIIEGETAAEVAKELNDLAGLTIDHGKVTVSLAEPTIPGCTGDVYVPPEDEVKYAAPETHEEVEVADTTASETQVTGVELDAEGLPWDARIHSSSKKLSAKGVWNRKRNTPDDLWESVRAELKGVMAAEAPAAVVVTDPVPVVPPAPSEAAAQVGQEAEAPTPPSVPVPPAPVAEQPVVDSAESSGAPTDFAGLLGYLQENGVAGDQELLEKCASAFGVPQFVLLSVRQDLLPQIHAWFVAELANK